MRPVIILLGSFLLPFTDPEAPLTAQQLPYAAARGGRLYPVLTSRAWRGVAKHLE